jgi:cytokinin dehydrogenase
MAPSSLLSDLRRRVEGEVTDAPEALALVSTDYGQVVRKAPVALVRPAHAADVAAIVRYASEQGVPVSPRAAGYSLGGQALCDGIVIDTRGLSTIHRVAEAEGWFEAGAGATWTEVLGATVPRGLVPPVLTSFHGTTLGGTHSVAGFGEATHRYGTQIESCLELEVVTGEGEIVRCSAEESADLFLHALGGLGQFGVITRIKHRLRRFLPRARTYFLWYDDLGALLGDLRKIVVDERFNFLDTFAKTFFQGRLLESGQPSPIFGHVFPMNATVEAADGASIRDEEVLSGLSFHKRAHTEDVATAAYMTVGRSHERRQPGKIAYVFNDVLLPWSAARRFVEAVLARLPSLIHVEHVRIAPVPSARLTRPMLPAPDEPLTLGFGTYMQIPHRYLDGVLDLCRRFTDLALSMGGRLYPIGSVRLDAARWRRQLGAGWPAARAAKRKFDKKGIFTPGFMPFEPEGEATSR